MLHSSSVKEYSHCHECENNGGQFILLVYGRKGTSRLDTHVPRLSLPMALKECNKSFGLTRLGVVRVNSCWKPYLNCISQFLFGSMLSLAPYLAKNLSPQFSAIRKTERIHGKHNFDGGKKKSKYRKYSKKRNKNKAKTNKTKLCMRWKYRSNLFAVFTCASVVKVFTDDNCSVICFVHITKDHSIWCLENRRTQIWQFRKQKTGDST